MRSVGLPRRRLAGGQYDRSGFVLSACAAAALYRRSMLHDVGLFDEDFFAYREDADGKPVYDWTIVDRIFDTYLARGVRPYAQIGFMPEALSIKPQPYQHQWNPALRYGESGFGS